MQRTRSVRAAPSSMHRCLTTFAIAARGAQAGGKDWPDQNPSANLRTIKITPNHTMGTMETNSSPAIARHAAHMAIAPPAGTINAAPRGAQQASKQHAPRPVRTAVGVPPGATWLARPGRQGTGDKLRSSCRMEAHAAPGGWSLPKTIAPAAGPHPDTGRSGALCHPRARIRRLRPGRGPESGA